MWVLSMLTAKHSSQRLWQGLRSLAHLAGSPSVPSTPLRSWEDDAQLEAPSCSGTPADSDRLNNRLCTSHLARGKDDVHRVVAVCMRLLFSALPGRHWQEAGSQTHRSAARKMKTPGTLCGHLRLFSKQYTSVSDSLLTPGQRHLQQQRAELLALLKTEHRPAEEAYSSLVSSLALLRDDGSGSIELYADSVMRKRKRKMNKHKHRKRRKLLRHKS